MLCASSLPPSLCVHNSGSVVGVFNPNCRNPAMADGAKQIVINGGTFTFDLKNLFSVIRTRRTIAYGFMFAFVGFTVLLALSPSSSTYSSWATIPSPLSVKQTRDSQVSLSEAPSMIENHTLTGKKGGKTEVPQTNQTPILVPTVPSSSYQTINSWTNLTSSGKIIPEEEKKRVYQKRDGFESLMQCDFFHGDWVRDDSYPLYKPSSCSLIDEQFNCSHNGRPDEDYQALRWKPKDCSLPRLNGRRMLNLLRGKRLVFVGDSLNRNMWESLVCILKNSARDQSNVFEEYGSYFRGEASFSFIFKDYQSSVEFFVAPFLVRQWEMPDGHGATKATLRLDLIGKFSEQYKAADIIVFNTGHWWNHYKTSEGKDYYQVGSHVYGEMNVIKAFRKALTTWARWVDTNVNPMKSTVFFRGISATHFSGGQWNSGGRCNNQTEPIKDQTFLRPYPPKMFVVEKILRGMTTNVTFLNITRMTDSRKDGHPSIYRKHNLSSLSMEERRSPLSFQDCSHWCLPGVPDAWNEILYAHLLLERHQKKKQ